MHTTQYARGTASYRAPELVQGHAQYNCKADIFAMGCIFFELSNDGKKAFAADFDLYRYTTNPTELFHQIINPVGLPINFLPKLAPMLAVDSSKRPSARDLHTMLSHARSMLIGIAFFERREFVKSARAYKLAIDDSPISKYAQKALGDYYVA